MNMKKIILLLVSALLLSQVFIACGDNNDDNGQNTQGIGNIPFTSSQTYVVMNLDNESFWQSADFSTCYVKIPSQDNTEWFDIVMTSSKEATASEENNDDKYLFIHAENPLVKSFSYDTTVTITSGVKIICYQGKQVENNRATYEKYFTNASGTLIITENDGKYMSGKFNGELQDIINKQTCNAVIMFNKIPVSLVK